MKKIFLSLTLILLLSACRTSGTTETSRLTVAATTYPIYLFATAVTEGVEGISVRQVVNQPTSCLHDYTLNVQDMKALEGADVVMLSGAGLETFLSDALAQTSATVLDCSAELDLHAAEAHEHDAEEDTHDEHGEVDPHVWMDPKQVVLMLDSMAKQLSELDPEHAQDYSANAVRAQEAVTSAYRADLEKLTGLLNRNLITFHDGFHYFADAFHLTILKAIEEEEGAETSAQELKEVVELVEEYHIPAIFTEVNGSDATAKAIARETEVSIHTLSMIMSGDGTGIQPYLDAMAANVDTILEALSQ